MFIHSSINHSHTVLQHSTGGISTFQYIGSEDFRLQPPSIQFSMFIYTQTYCNVFTGWYGETRNMLPESLN